MTENAVTHLKVIINSLELANRRGAFLLGESAAIHTSIKCFTNSNDKRSDTEQRENVENLLAMCNQAQRRGAFDLNEAYNLFPHIKFFIDLFNAPPATDAPVENIQQEITKAQPETTTK